MARGVSKHATKKVSRGKITKGKVNRSGQVKISASPIGQQFGRMSRG